MVLVENLDSLKQIQSQWQEQKQWAFAFDVIPGQAAGSLSLQLPSLPGMVNGETVVPVSHRMCLVLCLQRLFKPCAGAFAYGSWMTEVQQPCLLQRGTSREQEQPALHLLHYLVNLSSQHTLQPSQHVTVLRLDSNVAQTYANIFLDCCATQKRARISSGALVYSCRFQCSQDVAALLLRPSLTHCFVIICPEVMGSVRHAVLRSSQSYVSCTLHQVSKHSQGICVHGPVQGDS